MNSIDPSGRTVVGVEAVLRAHEVNGAAVVLIENGEVSQSSYFGFRDRHHRHRIDARTRFDMASTTKIVAALATVRASREGRAPPLDMSLKTFLDQRSSRRLSRWARRKFRRKKSRLEGITLRRLLSHTAGLSNHGIGKDAHDRPTSFSRVLRETRSKAVPGSVYDYSGGGYTVAESMVGAWAAPSATDVLTEFLGFMGMRDSTFAKASDVEPFAKSCSRGGCRGEVHTVVKFAGGLVATPTDYARVLRALMGEGPLPAEDIREVLTAGRVPAGVPGALPTIRATTCQTSSVCGEGRVCYGHRCMQMPLDDNGNGSMYGLGVGLVGWANPMADGLARCLTHRGAHVGSKRGSRSWFFVNRAERWGVVVVANGAYEWKWSYPDFVDSYVSAFAASLAYSASNSAGDKKLLAECCRFEL